MNSVRLTILDSRDGMPVGTWSVSAYAALSRDGHSVAISGDAMANMYALGGAPSIWGREGVHTHNECKCPGACPAPEWHRR